MSVGPLLVALVSVPSGLAADRLGGQQSSVVGLATIAAGTFMLALAPVSLGLAGYLVPIVVTTLGYSLFQTSNNMVVMKGASRDAIGAMSGLLNLTRNLGLITGASLMGAVFASATSAADLSTAAPDAVAYGMQTSFAVATVMVVAAFIAVFRSSASGRFP